MLQAAGMRGMQRQEGKLTGCGWGARGALGKGRFTGEHGGEGLPGRREAQGASGQWQLGQNGRGKGFGEKGVEMWCEFTRCHGQPR